MSALDVDVTAPPSTEEGLARVLSSRWALVALVTFGALLRLALYVADRSLTLDEAFIALNVERRSAASLLGELDWNSAAPPGFLELEKAMTGAFGSSEHVLRAAPFIASILVLIVFVRLAIRLTEPLTAIVALLMFVGLALTVSYSSLAKPYSFDVLFATSLCLATLSALSGPRRSWPVLRLTALGALASAFSYGSVFVLAASASVLAITGGTHRSGTERIRLLSVVGVWSALLLAWYLWHGSSFAHIQQSFGSQYLGSFSSIRNAFGAVRIVSGISSQSAELGTTVSAVATAGAVTFFLVGLFVLARQGWPVPAILVLPGCFAAIASAAHLYPLTPRTLLFIAPGLVICVAAGFVHLLGHIRAPLLQGAVIALLTAMIVSEASGTIRALEPVRGDEGIKPSMQILAERERRGDTLYLGSAAQYPFAYYLECECADGSVRTAALRNSWEIAPARGKVDQWSPALQSQSPRAVIGQFRGYNVQSYIRDFDSLRGRGRVWIVLTFLHETQRQALVKRLDRLGERIASFGKGSGVDAVTTYLYIV